MRYLVFKWRNKSWWLTGWFKNGEKAQAYRLAQRVGGYVRDLWGPEPARKKVGA